MTPHLLSQRLRSLISSLVFAGNAMYVRRINLRACWIIKKPTYLYLALSEQLCMISQEWTDIKGEGKRETSLGFGKCIAQPRKPGLLGKCIHRQSP